MATLSVGADGAPGVGPRASTSHIPQALELDPSGTVLLAAGGVPGTDGFRMTTFTVNAATGELTKVTEADTGANPIRLLMVQL